jgi:PAS domain-containing protein
VLDANTPRAEENEMTVQIPPDDDRKGEERALRDSQSLLFGLMHPSPLLMTISDLATDTNLEVNDTFCRVSGFSRAETIGKTSVELGWQTAEGWAQLQHELQTHGKVEGLEIELRNKATIR